VLGCSCEFKLKGIWRVKTVHEFWQRDFTCCDGRKRTQRETLDYELSRDRVPLIEPGGGIRRTVPGMPTGDGCLCFPPKR
jgi:hypothetical protein